MPPPGPPWPWPGPVPDRQWPRSVVEPVTPVDPWVQLAGLDEVREPLQLPGGHWRLHLGDVLAAAQRDVQQPPNAAEPGTVASLPGRRAAGGHPQGRP